MNSQYLISSKTIEIIKQKSRKLKKEKGITHSQALNEMARQYHFNHWHHVNESYKPLKATEQAVQSGLMIAMYRKEGEDFSDEKSGFIQDAAAFFFCEKEVYRDCIEAFDADGVRFIDKHPEEELKKGFKESYDSDYVFFRYTNPELPKTVNDVRDLIEDCSHWQPEYIWLNGHFYNENTCHKKEGETFVSQKNFSLEDFDFSQINKTVHKENMKEYLLKIVEDAKVVLMKDYGSSPSMLMPRQDLNPHPAGFSWGYSGSGVFNLAYAILGDCIKDDNFVHQNVRRFVEIILSKLDGNNEHTLTEKEIKIFLKAG